MYNKKVAGIDFKQALRLLITGEFVMFFRGREYQATIKLEAGGVKVAVS